MHSINLGLYFDVNGVALKLGCAVWHVFFEWFRLHVSCNVLNLGNKILLCNTCSISWCMNIRMALCNLEYFGPAENLQDLANFLSPFRGNPEFSTTLQSEARHWVYHISADAVLAANVKSLWCESVDWMVRTLLGRRCKDWPLCGNWWPHSTHAFATWLFSFAVTVILLKHVQAMT